MRKEYWAAEHIKIGHTYTCAEWVAGRRKVRRQGGVGYQFSFSTGISISRHHSSFAQHTSLPSHIDSSWLAETNQMVKWVSKGGKKKTFLSLLSFIPLPLSYSHSWCNEKLTCPVWRPGKIADAVHKKAVHECHYLNLIWAIFSVSIRLSHLQEKHQIRLI